MGIFLKSPAGDVIFRSLIADWDPGLESLPAAHFVFRNRIPPGLMAAGNYTVELHCSRYGVMDYRVDEKVSYLISIRRRLTSTGSTLAKERLEWFSWINVGLSSGSLHDQRGHAGV